MVFDKLKPTFKHTTLTGVMQGNDGSSYSVSLRKLAHASDSRIRKSANLV